MGGFRLAYLLYFTITWLPFYRTHEQHLSMRVMVNTAALYDAADAAAALETGWKTDFRFSDARLPSSFESAMAPYGLWQRSVLGWPLWDPKLT